MTDNVEAFFADMMAAENKTVKKHQQYINEKKENIKKGLERHEEISNRKKQIYATDKDEGIQLTWNNPQDLLQKIQRDINCLTSEDHSIKIKAIRKIKPIIAKSDRETLNYLLPHVHTAIIPLVGDGQQVAREAAIKMIHKFMRAAMEREVKEKEIMKVTKEEEAEHESWKRDIQEMTERKLNQQKIQTKQQKTQSDMKKWIEEEHLPILMTVLIDRMGCEGNDPIEKSETVREETMNIIQIITEEFNVTPYLNEIMNSVRFAFADKSGRLKMKAASVLQICAKEYKSTLHGVEALKLFVDEIKGNLTHKYAKVREYTLKGIYELLYIKPASEKITEIDTHLQKLAIDNNTKVKETLITVCKAWYIHHVDTYSYQHLFVMPLLMMISDKNEKISAQAREAIEEMGQHYEQWNEEKLKDKQEYIYEDVTKEWERAPAPFKKRPRLGARCIVKHNFKKIVEFVVNEAPSWSVTSRETVAKLERIAIIYTERDIVQHVEKMTSNWFKVVDDDDIQKAWQESIRIAGRWLDLDAYLPLVKAHFHAKWSSSPHLVSNVLQTLYLLIQGYTPKKDYGLKAIDIVNSLATPHLMYHTHLSIPKYLFACLKILAQKWNMEKQKMKDSEEEVDLYPFLMCNLKITANLAKTYPQVEQHHFTTPLLSDLNPKGVVSITQMGSHKAPKMLNGQQLEHLTSLFQDSKELMQELGSHFDSGIKGMYAHYFETALNELSEHSLLWDRTSEDLATFEYLIVEAIECVPQHASTVFEKMSALTRKRLDQIAKVDETTHDPRTSHFYQPSNKPKKEEGTDPYVITRMFNILWILIDRVGPQLSQQDIDKILKDMLAPHLTWRHGSMKRLSRQFGFHTIAALIHRSCLKPSHVDFLASTLHPSLLSGLDEHRAISRRIAASLFIDYYPLVSSRLTQQQQQETFATFIGMLDDECDDVRQVGCRGLSHYFCDGLPTSDDDFDKVVNLMLIHVDDPNSAMQQTVIAVLKSFLTLPNRVDLVKNRISKALQQTNFQQAQTRELLSQL